MGQIQTVRFLEFSLANQRILKFRVFVYSIQGLLNWVYSIFHPKSNDFGRHFGNTVHSDFPLRFGYIKENFAGGWGGGSLGTLDKFFRYK